MKLDKKKALSIGLATMMTMSSSATLATPTHVIIENRAYAFSKLIDGTEYHKKFIADTISNSDKTVYVTDNGEYVSAGKEATVYMSGLEGDYYKHYKDLENVANEVAPDPVREIESSKQIKVYGRDDQKQKCETLTNNLALVA